MNLWKTFYNPDRNETTAQSEVVPQAVPEAKLARRPILERTSLPLPAAVVGLAGTFSGTATAHSAQVDGEFFDQLKDALATVNVPGVGEFENNLEGLSEDIPDERRRFVRAFKLAERSDLLTVEKIMTAFHKCEQVLDSERREFEAGLGEEVSAALNSKSSRRTQISDEVSSKRARIEELRREITKLDHEVQGLQAEDLQMQAEIQEVERTRDQRTQDFEGALTAHQRTIQEMRNKVQAYLATEKEN